MRAVARSAALFVLLAAGALPGCGGTDAPGSVLRPGVYAIAASGSSRVDGTLELTGVDPTATLYTMRPNREAEAVKVSRLDAGWGDTFKGGAAVCAVSLDASAGDEAPVMTLSDPAYDRGSGRLRFTATDAPAGSPWKGKPLSGLPQESGAVTLFVNAGAGLQTTPIFVEEGAVSISFRGLYYYVNIDMTRGVSHRDIGRQYARAINSINGDAERRISTYVSTLTLLLSTAHDISGRELIARADEIKRNLVPEYVDEIDGLASGMKSYFPLSASHLMYLYNLLSDVFRWTQCSAFGVWGSSSSGGANIVQRNLDWYEGIVDEMTEIQAVVRYHHPDRDVQTIGALGHLGCITGITTGDPSGRNGIMGAIMDADVPGTRYSAEGCRSYNFDLRYCLESFGTKEEIAAYMSDKPYTFDNLVLLADGGDTVVLENNTCGLGKAPSRSSRYDNSALNPGIAWGYPSMIGAVNGFCLEGQVNNFSRGINGEINTERWALLREKIEEHDAGGARPWTPDDVRKVMTSYSCRRPGSLNDDEGDLYNRQTQQMLLYVPADGSLEVFFKPLDGSTPVKPEFTRIPLGSPSTGL